MRLGVGHAAPVPDGRPVGEMAEIEDDTSRMNKMIGDLLLLAQADSGALQLQMELVEMDTLVLDVYRQAIKIAERTKGPDALAIHLGHEDQALVKGDATVPAISAASILAKVARDAELCELHDRYPAYGFARHKGYPTLAHREALRRLGPCPEHRRSFAPVAAVLHTAIIRE